MNVSMLPLLEKNPLKPLSHKRATQNRSSFVRREPEEERSMAQPCEAGKKQHHHYHGSLLLIARSWGVRRGFVPVLAIAAAFAVFLTLRFAVKNGEYLQQAEKMAETARCDLSSGRWVYDNSSYPLYREKECMFMSDQLACEKFGRKDFKYQNWRWQPHACDLPRFNATALLERLRGRRLVFVGDSLNRGQWVSMVCLLGSVISPPNKAMVTTGNLIAFKAKEYNASIEFYWAPLLVESNSDHPVNHRLPQRIIRAHSIEKHGKHWTDADILVFNSYLWWRKPSIKVLWGSFDDPDGVYKEVGMVRSFELALKTWADWLEFHVDSSRTRLFFMSLSPTHFWGEEWGAAIGRNCYNETEPIDRDGHTGRDSDPTLTRVVEAAIGELRARGVDVDMVDVTRLSEYRKDGHPSVYRKQWEPLSEDQIKNPSSYADCIHWCLPGVPDVWNELLYAYIFPK